MAGERILVVDDAPDILEALVITLNDASFETLGAPDGRTALRSFLRVPTTAGCAVELVEEAADAADDERRRSVPTGTCDVRCTGGVPERCRRYRPEDRSTQGRRRRLHRQRRQLQ